MSTSKRLGFCLPILIAGILFSSVSRGSAAAHRDPSCLSQNATEDSAYAEFTEGWRMNPMRGDFRGLCIDPRENRIPKVLSMDADSVAVANIKHLDQFWQSQIEFSNIKRVSAVAIHFKSGIPFVEIAHIELKIDFIKPIRLNPQAAKTPSPQIELPALVLSWESFFPIGHGLEVTPTLTRNFAIGGQALSLEQSVSRMNRNGEKILIEEWPLALTPTEQKMLLIEFLDRAERRGLSQYYILMNRNCVSEFMSTLDDVLKRIRPGITQKVAAMKVRIGRDPVLSPFVRSLIAREILLPGDKSRRIDVR